VSRDPNWKPDPAKVAELIAEHDVGVTAQQLLVDKLDELLDQAERELRHRQDRVAQLREAWAKHGVVIP
jgi:flagellar biosynthesis chaperone FliJ